MTETYIPQGFSVKPTQEDASAVNLESVTIVAGQTADIDFVNTYKPEKSDAPTNVSLKIAKHLTGGEDWAGGKFRFILEKHVETPQGATHVQVGSPVEIIYEQNATGEQSTAAIALSQFITEGYTEPGVYAYRIGEIPDGGLRCCGLFTALHHIANLPEQFFEFIVWSVDHLLRLPGQNLPVIYSRL